MNERDTLERELRAALHGLADDHVPPPLPRDLWERGRTPSRRAWDALTVAAAVVLVALLASVVVLQRPDLVLRPAEAPGDGALPTDVWVPGPMDGSAPPDLDAVGRASFAGLLGDGTVLLVDAVDGEHQLRTLPDLSPLSSWGSEVALSPDGTQLAWIYALDEGSRDTTQAGVAVADLVGGGWTRTPLVSESGLPVRVETLQWSFNGRWLAWSGSEFVPDEGDTSRHPLVGVVGVTGGPDRTWEMPRKWPDVLGATDEGGLLVSDEGSLWRLSGDEPAGVLDRASTTSLPDAVDNSEQWSSPVSPDGSTLLTTAWAEDRAEEALTAEVDLTTPGAAPRVRSWTWADDQVGNVRALGWTREGAVLALPTIEEASILRSGDDLDDASTALTRIHLDGQLRAQSVATALGDADPVDFAPPAWAPGRPRWLVLGLVAAATTAAAWVLRRRRRTTRPDRRELRSWAVAVALTAAGVAVVASGVLTDVPVGWVLGGAVVLGLALSARDGVDQTRAGQLRAAVLTVVVAVAIAPLWPRPSTTSDDAVLPRVAHLPASDGYDESSEDWPPALADPPGAASVVVSSEWGNPATFVDPLDGTHRARTLPGLGSGPRQSEPTPVLDATGTRLAWARTGDPVDRSGVFDEEAWSGIAVLDLMTGDLQEVALTGRRGKPVHVERLSWSPDASHLAWYGDEAARWNENGATWAGRTRTAGVTRVSDLESTAWDFEDLPSPWSVAVAVDDDGVGRLLSGRRMWTYALSAPDRTPTVRPVSDRARRWSSAVISPDNASLVAGVNGGTEVQPDVTGLRTLDLTAPDSRVALHPWDGADPGDRVDVLGLTPSGLPVVAHGSNDHWQGSPPDTVVRVLDGARSRPLTRIPQGGSDHVAVATDLADREPVEFAAPRPQIGDGRLVLLAITGVALVAQLVALARTAWTRRRRRIA